MLNWTESYNVPFIEKTRKMKTSFTYNIYIATALDFLNEKSNVCESRVSKLFSLMRSTGLVLYHDIFVEKEPSFAFA